MSVLPVGFGSSSGVDVGDIDHSVRLRASASAYLSRTFGAGGNRRLWSYGEWIKCGDVSGATQQEIISVRTADSDTGYLTVKFNTDRTIYIDGFSTSWRRTTQLFRDPVSHFHFWLIWDSENATAADRIRLYINFQRVTSFSLQNNPSTGTDYAINQAAEHNIGRNIRNANAFFDGYRSRICFIDGAGLAPTEVGYLNTDINEWVSKSQSEVKAVVDAGGANSFMLDFDDTTSLTTLGYDKSSKANNWTLNNFSLTAGTTYDHMLDVPGNSFATLNPLRNSMTLSNANLTFSAIGNPASVATLGMTSGKWYWEVLPTSTYIFVGLIDANSSTAVQLASAASSWCYYGSNGNKYSTPSGSGAYGATYGNGDVIGVAFDADAGTLTFYKNNVSQGTAYTGLTSGPYFAAVSSDQSGNAGTGAINFGQRPFAYTPPTGFLALCQANLPDIDPASLLDPTDHHIDITVTKSGDTNFTLPWNATNYDTFFEIKRRDAAGDWYQIDGLRGYDKILKSNSTAAETTDANVLGISGTTGTLKSTLADGTYIVSATKAGLSASRQTNTDGSITSTVSRNVDSGFSIVTWAGSGSASATVGHGLGKVLGMEVVKNRSGNYSWPVLHASLPTNGNVFLNLTQAYQTTYSVGGLVNPTTSSTFTFTTTSTLEQVNASGSNYVAYCYADSDIQKSFSYTGNGNADGPYVNLGFKCGRSLIKLASSTSHWVVIDNARSTYNETNEGLYADSSGAEGTGAGYGAGYDITAIGLKVRKVVANEENISGGTYIGHAWAATTGKYSLAR